MHPLGAVGCTDPLAAIAWRRVVTAAAVAAVVVLLARMVGPSRADLGLIDPGRPQLIVAALGLIVVALGGLVIGPIVAEPFFGRLTFDRPLCALLPAIVFGVANGTLEEVAYRGALLGWLRRVIGLWPALLLQAVVFGLVHIGPEVTDLVPVHAALLGSAGLAAGLIAVRKRSLAIPIGVHIGADIALYYGLACRAVTG